MKLFKKKTLPEKFYSVLPEDFKNVSYRNVSSTEWFGIRGGYSYMITKKDNKLVLTKSGLSMTGGWGNGGIISQGLKKEKQDTEITEVPLPQEGL